MRHLLANLAAARYAYARLRRRAIAAARQLVMELPALWLRPHEQVVALVREIQGDDAVLAAQRAGKAILFLTPHMGAFEVAAQYAASRLPITVLYRRPKLAWLEPLMRAGRERANVRLVPADLGGVRELFKSLARGEAVGVLPGAAPAGGARAAPLRRAARAPGAGAVPHLLPRFRRSAGALGAAARAPQWHGAPCRRPAA